MKEKNTAVAKPHEERKDGEFKGFTMEELKYKRAMMALRVEFAKEQMQHTLAAMQPKRSDGSSSRHGSKFALARTIASKVFTNLNTLDYVMMGVSLFGTAKKAYNLFRKKK